MLELEGRDGADKIERSLRPGSIIGYFFFRSCWKMNLFEILTKPANSHVLAASGNGGLKKASLHIWIVC